MNLQEFFQQNPKVALAFSGGVDSSYLLYAGLQAKADIRPYFIKTAFQPGFELEDARRLADELKVELTVINFDVLADPIVTANPADRCYHCKKALFGLLSRTVAADGYQVLIDGTNASDDADDRPGMRALAELSVLSPLRLCGISKDMVRERSRQAGLFTWDKPAYACLATRVPTNTRIDLELLMKIEAGEKILFNLGLSDFRVRLLGNAARLELPVSQMPRVLALRETLVEQLKDYFDYVLLDLSGR